MYEHRDPRRRVDVVDLDPYGTAAPFIDAAIGCIADGGQYLMGLCLQGSRSQVFCALHARI